MRRAVLAVSRLPRALSAPALPPAVVPRAAAVAVPRRAFRPSPAARSVSHEPPVAAENKTIVDLLRQERKRVADDQFALYIRHLHPDQTPPPDSRADIVDHVVSALAIEAAATEEVLFPVLRDLVGENKTWEEDEVVSSSGTKGHHAKNVFEKWVDYHVSLRKQLEDVHALARGAETEQLDRAMRELIRHVGELSEYENELLFPLVEAHFNRGQLEYMAKDYVESRYRVPHEPHPNVPGWMYKHPTLERAMNRVLRVADAVKETVTGR